MLLADVVRRFAVERPEHVCVKWADGRRRWRELDARSSQIAQALKEHGVGPGDRVLTLDKNGPELLELLYGAAKLGAVLAPLNFRLAAPEIAALVADSGARIWIVGQEFSELAGGVVSQLDPPVQVVVIGGSGTHFDYEQWLGEQPAKDPAVAVAPQDVGLQLYSSGTSGRPKGIELTHANLWASLGGTFYDDLMGLDQDAVNLIVLPMFHIGGGGWALAAHMRGATNVILRDAVPALMLEVIERERVTHTTLVPALMEGMLAVPDVDARDLRSLRAFFYGGAPISEDVLRRSVRAFGCEFLQAFGITETTGTATILPASDHDPHGPNLHRLRSCGVPRQNIEVRIVDPGSDKEVEVGQTGEFCFRGPTIMKGYWKQPELTAQTIVDGWYHSGDAGYVDADGYLYLQDRIKDMIISGGENIYPAEIENALSAHPAVGDVAVIGVPSERWGETPKAFVVPAAGVEVTEQELIEHCRQRIARYKCPTSVDFVDQLPRNPTGKILKKELRAPFWEGRERSIS